MHRTFSAGVLVAASLVLAACDAQGEREAPGPAAGEGGHHHAAPRGGTLVELEHEAVNLEFLLDPASGKLTAWVLDGCAEKPVRITQDVIPVQIVAGGVAFRMDLVAQESALTGERKGDTSEFAGQHDRLRGAATFKGLVENVAVAGRSFQGVKFQYARSK
jgi:hypothetical protein